MSLARENRIDLVRGLSLLVIFVDHSNLSFSGALQHSRGFCDAAELFVMMAGMSAALAYHPASGAAGFRATASRTLRRSFKLYWIHLLMLAAVVAAVFLLPFIRDPALVREWSLDKLAAQPVRYAVEAIFLRYLPAELDILPLYMLLIAAVPLFFAAIDVAPRLALAASVALWLLAGIFHLNLVDFSQPKGLWYFNPFSWQLVFVCGLLAGLRVRQGQAPFAFSKPLFILAFVFCLVAIPADLVIHLGEYGETTPLRFLISKTSEGPLRLINALAIVYVVFNLDALQRLSPTGWLRPVFAAGRNSLPIFVLGEILSDIVTVSVFGREGIPLALELLAVFVGVAILLGFALHRDRAKRRRSGKPASSLLVASQPEPDYGPETTTEPPSIPDARPNTAT
ncbi:OpgC family protein [Jiella mangrovi]|uniref:OpgC domain-containing protein n=1 Tax=Jiella mangrovi TaxID=2821407 RepID=A0ABS4BDG4_9HYPH|nr:OpgC domain-containing protein [Jiella mangrovi]MBP0614784.1 OpgC domain-containing protein [Jiella mangrovi]